MKVRAKLHVVNNPELKILGVQTDYYQSLKIVLGVLIDNIKLPKTLRIDFLHSRALKTRNATNLYYFSQSLALLEILKSRYLYASITDGHLIELQIAAGELDYVVIFTWEGDVNPQGISQANLNLWLLSA
jgi:hypothetical protein